jgi:hypothetical protein
MKDMIFYVAKNQTVIEIIYAALSFLWWIIPLYLCQIIHISIYHQYFFEISIFFIILSILLCLPPIKRAYFSLYYPIIRISDLYFIYDFDKNVSPWTSIEKIILDENNIQFSIKNEKLDKRRSETIKYVLEKEKLIKGIIKFSKKYDIPLDYTKS